MLNLHLEPRIIISALRGEGPAGHLAQLEHVWAIYQARANHLADKGVVHWTELGGDLTEVVILPSSEVLSDVGVLLLVERLARLARVAGIVLRLIDARPPVSNLGKEPLYSLICFGTAMLRDVASDPDVSHVTFHPITFSEMMELAESGDLDGLVSRLLAAKH